MHYITAYMYVITFLPLQASHKSDPGKCCKSDTISQESELEEQPKSKGKEKPTTDCRNKSINSSQKAWRQLLLHPLAPPSTRETAQHVHLPPRLPRPRKPRRARTPEATTTTAMRRRQKHPSPAAAAMTATAPHLMTATTNS
jgi:hypothetical protein